MIRRTVLAIAFLVVAVAPTASAQDFPEFTNHVVDDAGVVPDDAEAAINAELADYQRRSTNQISVAVLETYGDNSLEDYTNDLFEAWGVGDKDKDNGVLLLIAMEERDIRIETGFGAEGDLTDLESGRIVRNVIAPRMRQGDVGAAVLEGTREMRRAMGDEDVGAPPEPIVDDDGGGGSGRGIGSLFWIIPFLVFGPLSAIGRRAGRRRGWIVPVIWGGGGGFGGRGGFGGGGFGGGGGGGSGGGGASGGW